MHSTTWATSAAIVLLWTCSAAAGTCPVNVQVGEAVDTTKSNRLCVNGVPGMWFPMPSARQMLKDIKSGSSEKLEKVKLSQKLSLCDERTSLLQEQVKTVDAISDSWRKSAEEQAKQAQNKSKWYKAPTLWFAVGFVAATAVGYGLAQAYANSN